MNASFSSSSSASMSSTEHYEQHYNFKQNKNREKSAKKHAKSRAKTKAKDRGKTKRKRKHTSHSSSEETILVLQRKIKYLSAEIELVRKDKLSSEQEQKSQKVLMDLQKERIQELTLLLGDMEVLEKKEKDAQYQLEMENQQ